MSLELLIIGLHRVGIAPSRARIKGLFISPKLLEFQLSLLRNMGFRFATLREAAAHKNGRFAVITFDDGYLDNLTNGLPILRKFDAPATVFVITGDAGKQQVVWNEAAEDLPADLLSWKDIEKLHSEGWEIGSHSHRHAYLSRRSAAEQEDSILQSIEEIRHRLGTEPVSFAYPYGDFQPETKKILKGCGIRYAVTTETATSLQFDENTDFLELPRVSLGGFKIHHYLKSLKRTIKAVGTAALLDGLSGVRHSGAEMTITETKVIQHVQK